MIRALFPGKFDPIHNGQIDIACRAARLFDEVVLAVCDAGSRKPLFTIAERVELVRQTFLDNPKIRVISDADLCADPHNLRDADVIVGGMSVFSDFDREFRSGLIWPHLPQNIELISLISDHETLFISSTLVKEIAALGGDVSGLVPAQVIGAVRKRMCREEGN